MRREAAATPGSRTGWWSTARAPATGTSVPVRTTVRWRRCVPTGTTARRHVARQFDPAWFADRDLVVALDAKNLQSLRWHGAGPGRTRSCGCGPSIRRAAAATSTCPIPYYDGPDGFEAVLGMVEAACDGLLAHVRAELEGQRAEVRIAGLDLLDPRPVSGGDICQSFAARTAAGGQVFAKTLPDAPAVSSKPRQPGWTGCG